MPKKHARLPLGGRRAKAYFMKNHSRMMIGIGTPTSHRMMERIVSPHWIDDAVATPA
jgi:hypothetical protein